MTDVDLLSVIAQVATASGFAGLTWWLIVKEIPKQRKDYQDQNDRQMQRFASDLDKVCQTHERVHQQQREQHTEEIDRLLTVVGKHGTSEQQRRRQN